MIYLKNVQIKKVTVEVDLMLEMIYVMKEWLVHYVKNVIYMVYIGILNIVIQLNMNVVHVKIEQEI